MCNWRTGRAMTAYFLLQFAFGITTAFANDYVTQNNQIASSFSLVTNGQSAPRWRSERDYAGVCKVATHLQRDIERVTGLHLTLIDDMDITLHSYLTPAYDSRRGDGLTFAVSIDDQPPQIMNLHAKKGVWAKRAGDHIAIEIAEHDNLKVGEHTLKVWLIDSGLVFQKFVIDTGSLKTNAAKSKGAFHRPITNLEGLKPSYLGPLKASVCNKDVPSLLKFDGRFHNCPPNSIRTVMYHCSAAA